MPKLNVKPYRGFIQPKLVPVMKGGQLTDVTVEYPTSFYEQMDGIRQGLLLSSDQQLTYQREISEHRAPPRNRHYLHKPRLGRP